MAKTYTSTIPTDKDFVRLWSGDHYSDMTTAYLEDEEILSILSVSPNKWYAAASALELIIAKFATTAGGTAGGVLLEKQVEDLKLKYSDAGVTNSNAREALKEFIEWLRIQGARDTSKKPAMFRVLGRR